MNVICMKLLRTKRLDLQRKTSALISFDFISNAEWILSFLTDEREVLSFRGLLLYEISLWKV